MNFKPNEFNCKCGKNKINFDFVNKLNQARIYSDFPYVINSGFRCRKHNKEVGGSETSSHLKGLAVDIRAETSRSRYLILKGLIKAKFNRIGIGENFIHVDDDKEKEQNLIWRYK